MSKLNFKETTNDSMLAVQACANARIPVCIIGEPGTSKTASIIQLAKDIGYDLYTLILSRSEAPDISGYPSKSEYKINGEVVGEVTEYAPQIWQKEIIEKKKVILFLDEFSNTLPATRASVLSLIQDRQFPNGEYFPEETIIIIAMNPVDSAADGNELDPATTNRMMFLSWNPSRKDWLIGMKDDWGSREISKKEQEWRNLIIRFIDENPGFLQMREDNFSTDVNISAYGVPQNSSSETVFKYAWASRRSWNNLARVLGGIEKENIQLEDTIASGLIGYKAATNFRDWLRKNKTLDVDSIVRAPETFEGWTGLSVDDVNMILRSAIDRMENLEHVENATTIMRILADEDLMSYGVPHLASMGTEIGKILTKADKADSAVARKNFTDVVKRYRSYTQNKPRTVAK